MIIEFEHCDIRLKFIGTQEEIDIHEYCHTPKRGRSDNPLVIKGKKKSKSPNGSILDEGTTSTRWCLTCQEHTVFYHKFGAPHSKCTICQQTHSSRGKLTTKMNKVFRRNIK
jgi:hypothetical protein